MAITTIHGDASNAKRPISFCARGRNEGVSGGKRGPEWRTNPEHLPFQFAKPGKDSPQDVVLVDVAAIDSVWKIYPQRNLRIWDDGTNQIGDRTENIVRHLKEGGTVSPSIGSIDPETGGMCFRDGRHRFSLLRDAGVRCLPVASDVPESLRQYSTTPQQEKAKLLAETQPVVESRDWPGRSAPIGASTAVRLTPAMQRN